MKKIQQMPITTQITLSFLIISIMNFSLFIYIQYKFLCRSYMSVGLVSISHSSILITLTPVAI